MSLMESVQHLKIPLEKIKLATKNFSDENFIAQGGFGKVYFGTITLSKQQISVAVKRLDRQFGQGNREFSIEIQMLTCYRHKNLVALVGFCDENGECILVYEHAKHGSLDRYLSNTELSWIQRLRISLGAARGLNYLHHEVGPQHRVLHRDIKSPNILLDENWEAKVSDFGLSKIGPSNVEFTFLVTGACGTIGYIDPQFLETGILTKESDVYSFGVLLFELLCGRQALLQGESIGLATLARKSCEENRLDEIIFPDLKDQMREDSMNVFSAAAYQCLKEKRSDRPTMGWIVEKLKNALRLQVCNNSATFIRVGTWGEHSANADNNQYWRFKLERNHKLQKITIDHGDVIHSLIFTTQCKGIVHTSNKAGGSANGDRISEVMLEADEEIINVKGTIGRCRKFKFCHEFLKFTLSWIFSFLDFVRVPPLAIGSPDGNTVISSLTFVTNKRTHGPFGRASKCVFSIPWGEGSLVGFYGLAGDFIDGIGVYLKGYDETMKVGPWGSTGPPRPEIIWSFELERNHHLKEITIDHGDLIYSLIFITQYQGLKNNSGKAGGWNGGDQISVVTLDWDEEMIGVIGTIALSRGSDAGRTVISSISFATDKRTHGPFGTERGMPFTVHWDRGSFAGFYGLAGYYVDSIGVYLKDIV